MEYPIGTKFKSSGKFPRECTVIDILKTYNSKNELVKVRYVATNQMVGQVVKNNDVCGTEIARGLV